MPEVLFRLRVPEGVAWGHDLEKKFQDAAEQLLCEQTVLRLFHNGDISTGTAAQMLGLHTYDFLQFASRKGVPVFDQTEEELAQDLIAARNALPESQEN
jgi:predicted HTH domain antitoxin